MGSQTTELVMLPMLGVVSRQAQWAHDILCRLLNSEITVQRRAHSNVRMCGMFVAIVGLEAGIFRKLLDKLFLSEKNAHKDRNRRIKILQSLFFFFIWKVEKASLPHQSQMILWGSVKQKHVLQSLWILGSIRTLACFDMDCQGNYRTLAGCQAHKVDHSQPYLSNKMLVGCCFLFFFLSDWVRSFLCIACILFNLQLWVKQVKAKRLYWKNMCSCIGRLRAW